MTCERTLVMLGSRSVGKTSLTSQFINGTFPNEYETTMHRTLMHNITSNGTNYKLTVYDTAGLEHQSQIPTKYYKAEGFILVYSITDRQSFDIIREVFEKLSDDGAIKHVILIGNKTDLVERRCISTEDGRLLAESMNAQFLETSARLGSNVEEVFTKLLRAIDPISFDQQYNTRNQIVFQTTQQQQQQQQQHPQLQSDHSEGIRQPAAQDKKSWWWNRISWLPFGTTKQASKQAC